MKKSELRKIIKEELLKEDTSIKDSVKIIEKELFSIINKIKKKEGIDVRSQNQNNGTLLASILSGMLQTVLMDLDSDEYKAFKRKLSI